MTEQVSESASDRMNDRVKVDPPARVGFRLSQLEVLNWGTFDRAVWRINPGGDTSLLTGDIGSGKSTLVDAITTLLLPAHKIAYNKAAGADGRERSLRSYVEGYYKSERVESSGRSRPIGLRTGARSYSVILGVFTNDAFGLTVTIAQVFQQREQTGQPYRFFAVADRGLTIADDFAGFGADLRDLRRQLKNGGVKVHDDYPKYSTELRRALGIRSQQALELFHQTVSMKSVGNLNDFVRDHMLEPSDATERVAAIIDHFEALTKAHDAVKRAREQLELLEPVVHAAAQYDQLQADLAARRAERDAVETFIAEMRSALLRDEISALGDERRHLQSVRDRVVARKRDLEQQHVALIEQRAQQGGNRLGELERLAAEASRDEQVRRTARAVFDQAIDEARLAPVHDAAEFERLGAVVTEARAAIAAERSEIDERGGNAAVDFAELEREYARLSAELASLKGRTSNLPTEQVEIRAQLAQALGCPPSELPYAGELLDVSTEHALWRGAAERVLRGFALSLLVAPRWYDDVSQWVNGRRLQVTGRDGRLRGTRLTYERVPESRVPLRRESADGLILADCLDIKEGEFEAYLAGELIVRAKHRCATSLEEFRSHRIAVTAQGQVRSGNRHDKDDRHRVDDPRSWVLGWNNERKIAVLAEECAEVDERRNAAAQAIAAARARAGQLQTMTDALNRVAAVASWESVDHDEAAARLQAHEAERQRLEAGSSRLAEIAAAIEGNRAESAHADDELTTLTAKVTRVEAQIEQASEQLAADERLVASRSAEQLAQARATYDSLERQLGDRMPTRAAECTAATSTLSDELARAIDRLGTEQARVGNQVVRGMGEIVRRWPHLQADMDVNIEARGDFVAFHRRVVDDELPKFEAEFKDQLNKNAIQELAGFNNWLGREAGVIDERVEQINEALSTVPYNPGRYIRLEKEQSPNQDVATFRADLRNLTNDSLVADGDVYSEQRFLDVKRIIERFRGREGFTESDRAWTKRVTDVRNWFMFSASERDIATDDEWEHYSDSDGKSGGQKEKLAYTILAASLAYQFGLEWGSSASRGFRFAVIDEAFGRGSEASSRYALELFANLGLQLLIVTPLQKIHVIEPFVSSIALVVNPTGTSSQVSTMTIEQYRKARDHALRPRDDDEQR